MKKIVRTKKIKNLQRYNFLFQKQKPDSNEKEKKTKRRERHFLNIPKSQIPKKKEEKILLSISYSF
jgi:hypothetical protein